MSPGPHPPQGRHSAGRQASPMVTTTAATLSHITHTSTAIEG